jgi:hypothetical protein
MPIGYRKPMPSLHIEHLENFITEEVADFDGDFAYRGSGERLAAGSVKVIKGKWNENNFMLHHGMLTFLPVEKPTEFIHGEKCVSDQRAQQAPIQHFVIGNRQCRDHAGLLQNDVAAASDPYFYPTCFLECPYRVLSRY